MSTQQEVTASNQTAETGLPWQLWVVISLLGLEGFGNLLSISALPIAAFWLVWKIVFVCGFLYRSRFVAVLFCFFVLLHVLAFAVPAPFVAFLNLLMFILVLTQYRFFFRVTPQSPLQ